MRPVYRFPSGDAHLANIRAMAEFFARFATGAQPEPKRVSPDGERVSSPKKRFFLSSPARRPRSLFVRAPFRSRKRRLPFSRHALSRHRFFL
jgi:hypothetical protein